MKDVAQALDSTRGSCSTYWKQIGISSLVGKLRYFFIRCQRARWRKCAKVCSETEEDGESVRKCAVRRRKMERRK